MSGGTGAFKALANRPLRSTPFRQSTLGQRYTERPIPPPNCTVWLGHDRTTFKKEDLCSTLRQLKQRR